MRPSPWPTANTGSRRWRAYAKSATPPRRLRYQNNFGMVTRRARSEAIHWTKKREPNVSWPRKPIVYQIATGVRRLWFIGQPPYLVTQHPCLEPAYTDEIAYPSNETIPHSVLRTTVLPRPVTDRQLRDPRAAELAERREESVGALEKRDSFKRLAAIGLERAAHVRDRIPDGRAPYPVRDFRGDTPGPRIRARRSHARDHVGPLQRVKQRRDAGRIVL